MYYLMSDIHGCSKAFLKALEKWDKENETLVLMGDYIDRGPKSLKVVRKIMELKEQYGDKVVVLKGNHEDMLTSWLIKTPYELLSLYYNEHHSETLKSFLGELDFKKKSRRQRAETMIHNFKKELRFLDNLPLYHEVENMIFVHAGINMNTGDWREKKDDLLWIRSTFIYSSRTPEKRVFFGHTPTHTIHKEDMVPEDTFFNMNSVWVSEDKMKVGIDGGVSMGGQLNALKVNESGEVVESLSFK